jgi:hypothetical protein
MTKGLLHKAAPYGNSARLRDGAPLDHDDHDHDMTIIADQMVDDSAPLRRRRAITARARAFAVFRSPFPSRNAAIARSRAVTRLRHFCSISPFYTSSVYAYHFLYA